MSDAVKLTRVVPVKGENLVLHGGDNKWCAHASGCPMDDNHTLIGYLDLQTGLAYAQVLEIAPDGQLNASFPITLHDERVDKIKLIKYDNDQILCFLYQKDTNLIICMVINGTVETLHTQRADIRTEGVDKSSIHMIDFFRIGINGFGYVKYTHPDNSLHINTFLMEPATGVITPDVHHIITVNEDKMVTHVNVASRTDDELIIGLSCYGGSSILFRQKGLATDGPSKDSTEIAYAGIELNLPVQDVQIDALIGSYYENQSECVYAICRSRNRDGDVYESRIGIAGEDAYIVHSKIFVSDLLPITIDSIASIAVDVDRTMHIFNSQLNSREVYATHKTCISDPDHAGMVHYSDTSLQLTVDDKYTVHQVGLLRHSKDTTIALIYAQTTPVEVSPDVYTKLELYTFATCIQLKETDVPLDEDISATKMLQ